VLNFLTILGVGFLLGLRHATDPDHVIAVTTIVSRQRSIKHAGLIGMLWGIGHTITILFVGAAIILSNLVIPPHVGLTMELAVGLMLIFLGFLNLTGITQWVTNRWMAEHRHGGIVHSHSQVCGVAPQVHVEDRSLELTPHPKNKPENVFHNSLEVFGLYQILRPLVVGIVHGLAGSAAVALLVLTTIRNPRWGVVYLLVFGSGTIAGMMLITLIIGAPFAFGSSRFTPFHRGLAVASGLVSVGFGLFITFHVGIVDGLFSANPHFTPH
jgi:High-affinity nickel-transport protein